MNVFKTYISEDPDDWGNIMLSLSSTKSNHLDKRNTYDLKLDKSIF